MVGLAPRQGRRKEVVRPGYAGEHVIIKRHIGGTEPDRSHRIGSIDDGACQLPRREEIRSARILDAKQKRERRFDLGLPGYVVRHDLHTVRVCVIGQQESSEHRQTDVAHGAAWFPAEQERNQCVQECH